MKKKRMWNIFWAPEGRKIATVWADTARQAKQLTPEPYKRYLGEVYVEEAL